MGQIRKAEGQIEIKCHADKFFDVWARKSYLISKMCPKKYPKVELQEGDYFHAVASVTSWHYIADGKHEFVKTKIAEIDGKDRSVTYSYLDGQIIKNYYKYLKSKIQIIPKAENCIVKWRIDYEKMNEDAPDADIFVDFLLGVAKDMEAHLCHA